MYELKILTPTEVFFDNQVNSVIIPGTMGYLGILTGHAPLITSVKQGVVVITDDKDQRTYFDVSTGVFEVSENRATLLVDTIKPTQPVDLGLNFSS